MGTFQEVGDWKTGRAVVVVWVVGFLLFFPLGRQEPGSEGALAWDILGELGGERQPPWILHGTSVHSHPLNRERHYFIASGDMASVSSEGPIHALLGHQGKAVL